MQRADFDEVEKILMDEVVTRRKLGGFDMNASTILNIAYCLLQITQHLKERLPRETKADKA